MMRADHSSIPPLALTMGEPGGIGGEITVKAWQQLRTQGPVFFTIDDPDRLAALGAPVRTIASPADAAAIFSAELPVLPLSHPVNAEPGIADPANARAVIASLDTAIELSLSGACAGIVTNPIQKASLMAQGFPFPGHTEYLAAKTQHVPMPSDIPRGPVMMLAGKTLRTVPATIHEPLRDAVNNITTDQLIAIGQLVSISLRRDFGLSRPRLAFSGLNPHAGEQGALGDEEQRIIGPAVRFLTTEGIPAMGPLSADAMFHDSARAQYDAAICMYHDQALIPLKTLHFDDAVNITLGLPIIRTSPDHGSALDIAGKGLAQASSLVEAITLAATLAEMRRRAP